MLVAIFEWTDSLPNCMMYSFGWVEAGRERFLSLLRARRPDADGMVGECAGLRDAAVVEQAARTMNTEPDRPTEIPRGY
jgi:hypothetical protein